MRRRNLLAGRLAIVLCLSALAGCASTNDGRPGEYEVEVSAASDRILWMVTILALEKTGFPPGSDLDPSSMTAVSGWKMSLAPFKGDGFREQAIVHMERLEAKRYGIDVRVRRERNDSLTNPLDPSVAKWVGEKDNQDCARLVLQHILSQLGGEFEVGARRSKKFEEP